MNKDNKQIFESYIKINEIAFSHQQFDPQQFDPSEQYGDDPVLNIAQQLQKASGPLYGVPKHIFGLLIAEYMAKSSNALLKQINGKIYNFGLFLLEFERNNKNLYILINLDEEFIYPMLVTDFKEALDYLDDVIEGGEGGI